MAVALNIAQVPRKQDVSGIKFISWDLAALIQQRLFHLNVLISEALEPTVS